MKKILTIIFLVCIHKISLSQRMKEVKHISESNLKVWVAPYESMADLKVYVTPHENSLLGNRGHWYFCRFLSQANCRIFFVKNQSQADLVIFYVKNSSEAGWKNGIIKIDFYGF